MENARLKLELTERQRTLSDVRRSMSLLEHRLSLLMTVKPSRHQLDSLSQAVHNIARQVLCVFLFALSLKCNASA